MQRPEWQFRNWGGAVATGGSTRFLPTGEQVMREGLRLVISSLGYNTALPGAIAPAQDASVAAVGM